MNEDQEKRLDSLAEKICEAYLITSDPDNLSAAGKAPKDMTKEERGNLVWDLKIPNQFGLLFARTLELRQRMEWLRKAGVGEAVPPIPPGGTLGAVFDPDREIERFEAEAGAVLARLQKR